jgi:hypothetical protein
VRRAGCGRREIFQTENHCFNLRSGALDARSGMSYFCLNHGNKKRMDMAPMSLASALEDPENAYADRDGGLER